MSTEARASPSGGRDSVESLPPSQPYPPHFYPPSANYQSQTQPSAWFSGQLPPGVSGPWPPTPWTYPGPPPGWSQASGGKISPHSNSVAMPSDEYTVDTMKRIYNDDDGRIEIQRVKVHRRPPETSSAIFPPNTESMSVVPVGSFQLNERRPPPRKNKMKRQMELMQSRQGQQGSYPWYPYMPCMPYPYPYPYYYGGGCMWPPTIPPPSLTPWPGSDDSERTTSRQESLPLSLDSQRLDSRNSHSPLFARSPSPAATNHSIAPSDSVSVRGYKDERSRDSTISGPTPPPRTRSKLRAIMAPSDISSEAGDKSSISSTSTDIVLHQKAPPRRKSRKSKNASLSNGSSLDQKDIESLSGRSSVISEMTCDDSSKLNSELSYAFKKFEQSVDTFKTRVSVESTPVNTPPRSPSPVIEHSSKSLISKDDIQVSQSEHITEGNTDIYINKPDNTDDPSLASFSSLPLLETAPLESSVSSTPKKTEETLPGAEANDSRQEDKPQNERNVMISQSASDTSSSSKETAILSITKDRKPVQQTSVSQSIQQTDTLTMETNTGLTKLTNLAESTGNALADTIVTKDACHGASTMAEANDKDPKPIPGKLEVTEMELEMSSGRDSRLSSSTFFSLRPSDDPLHLDTDSTDILLPTTDATTADEGGEGTDWTASSPVAEDKESYQWVLQQPGEIPELTCSTADREDERRNAWRAEVSLWRARLVVSLCRGRGLDRQDWATFHLLVHHPLTQDLKLSILHAPRLCTANSTVGAALVRIALIHLAQYGETLLQPEASRQLGWRSIKVDANQSWSPVKGAVEILKALGYQEREDGVLRYPRRSTIEVSLLARLTLDMLVLAEELRLYLTGTHQYPTNISDLFFPSAVTSVAPTDGNQKMQDMPRPPSSTGSYSFLSAQSNTSLNNRPDSRASTVTDEDTETLQVSVRHAKAKKTKQTSSSEEEVTLKEELVSKTSSNQDTDRTTLETKEDISEISQLIDEKGPRRPEEPPTLATPTLIDQCSTNSNMSSLPDLQSVRSSMASLVNSPAKESDYKNSIRTAATPVPDDEETKDNPEEHIYEEIDVIRQQVQALRSSSVPVDIQPPPLPPKKKVSSGGEDDSGLSLTYPHMEWTSSSMPGSLRGGSTGARKKKRRAPMPPDFMPPGWKPYENKPKEMSKDVASEKGSSKTKDQYQDPLNPFYEDIDSVKSEVKSLNKASDNKGYSKLRKVKKDANPFEKEDYVVSGYVGKNPFYEDIDESEEVIDKKEDSHSATSSPKSSRSGVCAMGSLAELQDESIILKTKRRAPKPPSTPIPSDRTGTPQPLRSSSSPQPPRSPSSPQPPKHPPNIPPPKPPLSPQPPKSPSSPVSIRPPTTPPPRPPPPKTQKSKDGLDDRITEKEIETEVKEDFNQHEVTKGGEKNEINKTASDKDSGSQERSVIPQAIKTAPQRTPVQHPTIPPPPPPPKLADEEQVSNIPGESSLDRSSEATTQPSLDDIPYMDANEVNIEKEKIKNSEPSQYEIPELPGEEGIPPAPPLSPATMRQTALLLRGHRAVPFIDDSDLPPDCPPPPPPTSPPDSPQDTPKVSPPETPHASPPETPHVSPPVTPENSNRGTPCAEIKCETTENQKGSCEVLSITVHTREPSELLKSVTTKDNESIELTKESDTLEVHASSETDETRNVSSVEDNNALQFKAEETIDEPPPLPPKTSVSLNSNNDPYANQSVRSSIISEDRYEIPEGPEMPDIESPAFKDNVDILEPIEEGTKDDGAESTETNGQTETTEERYEIPEVVRETALSIGPEGMPVKVGGPTQSNRMDLESVFGPPKPPRRRASRNHSLPPPRPPKTVPLEEATAPQLPPKSSNATVRPASASTTSSYVTASAGIPTPSTTPTALHHGGTPKPALSKQRSKTRRSWPLLFCDCMYANCKNYDGINN